jgi:hypothetical protein
MSEKVIYDKHSKKSVDFEHPAQGKDHCEDCIYFQVFAKNKCAIVAGRIEPGDWCKEFHKGEKLELG